MFVDVVDPQGHHREGFCGGGGNRATEEEHLVGGLGAILPKTDIHISSTGYIYDSELLVGVKMRYTSTLSQRPSSTSLLHLTQIPDSIFPLSLSVESRRNHGVRVQPRMLLGLGAVVGHDLHGVFLFTADVEHSHFTTFRRDGTEVSLRRPLKASSHSRNLIIDKSCLLVLAIPDPHSVVHRRGTHHIVDDGMPLNTADLLRVAHHRGCRHLHMIIDAFRIAQQPQLDRGVFRRRGKQLLSKRRKLDIGDLSLVSFDHFNSGIEFAKLV